MFKITPVDRAQQTQIQHRIDNKTKPIGALGQLETIAMQMGLVWGADQVQINRPQMLIFAADHGIANSGVSVVGSEVTAQMLQNFVQGGAAINVFCKQVGLDLEVIDCGIIQPLSNEPSIINSRLGGGTGAIHKRAAMTLGAVKQGFAMADDLIERHHQNGTNLIALGEMGIGNTSSASAIMAAVLDISPADCVGRGTGINAQTLKRKQMLVEQALLLHHSELTDPYSILACVGGFEIVQMTGAMLAAAQRNMLVVVDGFIASVAALLAVKIDANVRDFLIFSHQSEEKGHQLLLSHLGAVPLLNLGLRLGEGSGAALAFPLLYAAANFYNDMASFEEANVESVLLDD
ncbi:nicotinate-nucleotide--dimethylbenzimidazole phosphoribosyltransferase [Shewanella gelidii]|uniref:Nicotinate-nucleotide--dimethylbenzimidazole phosphoribosyltransferase n=1 Tax=Shewanella gelidii TaxID=1642821 RepID=A0A917JN58_9GAMM|nr:nicotinate-nucleotide--dimethylbenzimidazole phosphoribosyltransferase [Shewanella gelidii]MCL1097907.1 nicotinate-nucleotide--dimethylbenzimidazole phosphoribosyltransferase [Shewanella gelidii]GGI77810.1 nicotinate-nucleotide--dimethylbenzimidazole phosphoribosyltransferase [Shewanella gelidii]